MAALHVQVQQLEMIVNKQKIKKIFSLCRSFIIWSRTLTDLSLKIFAFDIPLVSFILFHSMDILRIYPIIHALRRFNHIPRKENIKSFRLLSMQLV